MKKAIPPPEKSPLKKVSSKKTSSKKAVSKKALVEKQPRIEALTQTLVLERGWTRKMLDTLLGEPDEIKQNPRSKSAPPMRLFHLSRVVEMEASQAFLDAKEKSANRVNAALRSAIERRNIMRAEIAKLLISVPKMEMDTLFQQACKHYNDLWNERAWSGHGDAFGKYAAVTHDKDFLERIAVNYLRHDCSSYENNLASVYNTLGAPEPRILIRRRVYQVIGETYPDLAYECRRQQDMRNASY